MSKFLVRDVLLSGVDEKLSDQALAHFYYQCRFENNPLAIDDSYKIIKKRFLDKEFESLEVLESGEILAYWGLLKSNSNSSMKMFHFDYKLGNEQALTWIYDKLNATLRLGEIIGVEAFHQYKPIINFLSKHDLRVRRVFSACLTSKFIDGFKRNFAEEANIDNSLNLKKISFQDIGDAVELMKNEFKRNPQHGPDNNEFFENYRIILEDELKTDHCQYGFYSKAGDLLGHFGGFLSDDLVFGNLLGFHFMLSESLKKKNLLAKMYSNLLKDMVKHKVRVVVGSSSHPAVLKYFKKLNRKPFLYTFVQDKRLYHLSELDRYLNV